MINAFTVAILAIAFAVALMVIGAPAAVVLPVVTVGAGAIALGNWLSACGYDEVSRLHAAVTEQGARIEALEAMAAVHRIDATPAPAYPRTCQGKARKGWCSWPNCACLDSEQRVERNG